MDLHDEVLAAFQVEHREQIEAIRSFLASARDDMAPNRDELDRAFRMAHTLKGGARVCDLRSVEALGQRLETLFARVRAEALSFDAPTIEAIDLVLNAIEDCMAAVSGNRDADPPADALAAIERILGTERADGEAPRVSEPGPVEPPARAAEPTIARSPSAAAPPAGEVTETIRIRSDSLDALLRSADELVWEGTRLGDVGRELEELGRLILFHQREWESTRQLAIGALHQLGTMPQFARIARYLDSVEHGLRQLRRQHRLTRSMQRRSRWLLQSFADKLQRNIRRARMATAQSAFTGFRRMVVDLARQESKEIEFLLTGMEVEADRMVLQALKGPVMHMLRNAVAHGIETPEEREQAGKPRRGRVTLALAAAGNRLRIRVEDDGRGIDVDGVARAAARTGVATNEELEQLGPTALARVVFRPGLTTVEQVNELSGRGMGLWDAYEAAERLQGSIEVHSERGAGTTFTICVPPTISTDRLLLVGCAGRTYAIPIRGIVRLMRVGVNDVQSLEGRAVVSVGERPVRLFDLADLLGLARSEAPPDRPRPAVVIRSGGVEAAVCVDALLAERSSITKALRGPASQCRRVLGGILLEDGSVAVVLDPAELVGGREARRTAATSSNGRPESPSVPTVLVVDDSFTTRTLEKSILETHGYRVRIAVDGLEALALLRGESIDLVISDIEMPRLDGFGLLEEMKGDPRCARVPVIMVTSMERREDRERGLALGADAYIVKRKFDHQQLLDTIRQFV